VNNPDERRSDIKISLHDILNALITGLLLSGAALLFTINNSQISLAEKLKSIDERIIMNQSYINDLAGRLRVVEIELSKIKK